MPIATRLVCLKMNCSPPSFRKPPIADQAPIQCTPPLVSGAPPIIGTLNIVVVNKTPATVLLLHHPYTFRPD